MVYKCFELYLDINKAFILDLKLFVCFNVTNCQVSKSVSVEFTLALATTNIRMFRRQFWQFLVELSWRLHCLCWDCLRPEGSPCSRQSARFAMKCEERQLVIYVAMVQLEVEEDDSLADKTSSCFRRERME